MKKYFEISKNVPEEIIKNQQALRFGKKLPVDVTKADNKKMANFRFALNNMRQDPIDTQDIEQVQQRAQEYFNNCYDENLQPTIAGIANALGIDRRTLHQWANGKMNSPAHHSTAKIILQLIEENWELNMVEGQINPAVGIFLSVNNFHYENKQEVSVKAGEEKEERWKDTDVMDKYKKAFEEKQNVIPSVAVEENDVE